MIRRRLHVQGVVQGVGFRWACAREAERLSVAGWARNLPDGGVEIVAEGGAEAVEALTDWARRGPSSAAVTDVVVVEEPVRGEVGFEVRG